MPPPRTAHARQVVAAACERRYAGVTRWIEGTPLGRVLGAADLDEYLPQFDAIGAIAATVHNQSSGWVAPEKWRTFTHHVLPNIMPVVIVVFSINVGGVIISEASLSFLGSACRPTFRAGVPC